MSNSLNVCPSENAGPPALGPPGPGGPPAPWAQARPRGPWGPSEALGLPGRLDPRSSGGPQRSRGGGVREKDPGPRKAPRCLGVPGLFLRTPRGPQGLPCPGPAGPRAPRDPSPGALGAGRPWAIPPRPWRAPRAPEALRGREGGRGTASD